MVEISGGPSSIPGWLASRLGKASPSDGDKEKNQFLEDNGQTETNPVLTKHSVFHKGTQGAR
jgi:hypothetical protein